jgi:hypothetical protein
MSGIQSAVSVVDAAADFWKGRGICDVGKILFVPLFHFLLQIVIVIVWFFAFMCVVSLNEVKAEE